MNLRIAFEISVSRMVSFYSLYSDLITDAFASIFSICVLSDFGHCSFKRSTFVFSSNRLFYLFYFLQTLYYYVQ